MKVKASLEWKSLVEHLPKDITLDVPQEKCNLNSWNEYIKKTMMLILETRVRVKYDVVGE